MFRKYNNNPHGSRVGDCVVRAVSTAIGMEWEQAYMDLAYLGLELGDMPSSNAVWGTYLLQNGFERKSIPNTCPDCYTISDFCKDHPKGRYVVGTGIHAVAVIDGVFFDTWDSSDEALMFYFKEV